MIANLAIRATAPLASKLRTALFVLCCAGLLAGPLSPVHTATASSEQPTFSVASSVSTEDANTVVEAITFAGDYLNSVLDNVPEIELVVNVRSTGDTTGSHSIGFFSPGFMVIFTGSTGWEAMAPFDRTRVVVHEYVHAYQWAVVGDRQLQVPCWFIEGMAQYLSYDAVVRAGLVEEADVLDFNSWALASRPDTAPLNELEAPEVYYSGRGAVYEQSYLAFAHLMDGRPVQDLDAFMRLVASGLGWKDAFREVFGLRAKRFYDEFAVARAELISPREAPSAFAWIEPIAGESAIEIVSTSGPVAAGGQVTIIAQAEAGAICELNVIGGEAAEPLTRTTFANGDGALFWLVTIAPDAAAGKLEVTASCGGDRVTAEVVVTDP